MTVTEHIRENIRTERTKRGLTLKQLGEMIGKSESAIQGYEKGKTDIPLSVLESIANAMEVPFDELVFGPPRPVEEKPIKLKIYNLDERQIVSGILFKNGYRISQSKEQRASGKAVDYILVVDSPDWTLDSSR